MADQGMTLLAEGRTAEIYAWGDGAVLKLFRDWVTREHAEYEAELARAVSASGLPAPGVGELVDVGGRIGLVYERVDGPTLLEAIRKKPWTLRSAAVLLARLHADLHKTQVAAVVPKQREKLIRKIERADLLSTRLRAAALSRLADLPDGDALCHGDFHPGNIVMTVSGPEIIDWMDATRGHPHADVARSLILGRFGVPRGPRILVAGAHLLLSIYQREYGRQTGATPADIGPWLPVVAAARLDEGVDESPDLAAFVEQTLA
jgi:uncharacterized protein (TIGR02172 family)